MQIDIVSDVVCPWCYIGKRNLEGALSLYKSEHPEDTQDWDSHGPVISWHPFQLNPHLPVEGMSRAEYTASKFGGPDRAREVYARVANAGANAGIEFRFDDIASQPNTVSAHALILLSASTGAQDGVVESLFKGYFLEGRDLTDRDTLLELSERGGLSRIDGERCLDDAERKLQNQVEEQDRHARGLGVEGVPFFIFNQKLAVSGAQPPEVLVQAMTQAESQILAETDA